MRLGSVLKALSLGGSLLLPAVALSVTLAQIDTFEDGTVQGWIIGPSGAPHPSPPVVVPTGGPAGEGDGFLRLTSLPSVGPGSRLAVINQLQWAGNYTAAGVKSIVMDVRNSGATELSLRLVLADGEVVRNTLAPNTAISAVPVTVPAGGSWVTVTFPVQAADLTALSGSAAAALANVVEVRLVHSPSAAFPPPVAVAELGVDNIEAVATGGGGPGGGGPPPGGGAVGAAGGGGGGGCFLRACRG